MIDFGDAAHVLAGITCGYFSGFIPGVGNLVTLLLVYPFLLDSSLLQLLLFYMALTSTSQFSGSGVATVFGVPGEASSLPAVKEGKVKVEEIKYYRPSGMQGFAYNTRKTIFKNRNVRIKNDDDTGFGKMQWRRM